MGRIDRRVIMGETNKIERLLNDPFLSDPGNYGYNHRVYYSKALPNGSDLNFNPNTYDYQFLEAAVKIKNIVHNNQSTQMAVQSGLTAKRYLSYEEMMPYVYPIQEYLIGIGFLDEGDADGIMGPKTEGAIKRYEYNKPGIIEETWHSIKNMDLNLFK
jgi:hypothetical protein